MVTPVTPLTAIRRIRTAFAPAFAAVLLLAAGPLAAQEQATPGSTAGAVPADGGADEALEQYRVELIVFEYGDSLAGTTEDWSAPPDSADDTATGEETGTEADAETSEGGTLRDDRPQQRPVTDASSPNAPGDPASGTGVGGDLPEEPAFRFMPLPEQELELGEVYRRLRNTDGYQPLLHVAWQQPGYDPETAQALDLSRLAELPDRLQGEVRLYRSRFLHLELDLELWSEPGRSLPSPATTEPLFPDRGRPQAGEPLDALEPDVYRLSERRKLRSGELHYYDHPRYGVLAKVTPVELEEEPAEAPGTGEAEPADPAPTDASSTAG
ncbi:CsiV family protein [Lentisalinibacter salinarum]|uniref:CsiV family protein n=1 Tax=Lentisalinibacter salinarum TaxID=2992239 RepID=UPI003868652B